LVSRKKKRPEPKGSNGKGNSRFKPEETPFLGGRGKKKKRGARHPGE